jgi:hypothetical protein
MTVENPVVFVLSQFGNIKNCRISPSFDESDESIICYPPSVIWWYRDISSEKGIDKLTEKIEKFPGEFTWLVKSNRNCWMLYPSFLEDMSQAKGENIDQLSAYVMKNQPQLGVRSNLEFRKLIEFLICEMRGD